MLSTGLSDAYFYRAKPVTEMERKRNRGYNGGDMYWNNSWTKTILCLYIYRHINKMVNYIKYNIEKSGGNIK
ncbi:hypothetical protein LAD12857_09180 [Lacrimispora amygdalina]|uniref:Uncharacterized protein n=1 Tax=Lacrimispora amygdalina TaxID=253257 RepID=A0ABQ5M312_9FIRM